MWKVEAISQDWCAAPTSFKVLAHTFNNALQIVILNLEVQNITKFSLKGTISFSELHLTESEWLMIWFVKFANRLLSDWTFINNLICYREIASL